MIQTVLDFLNKKILSFGEFVLTPMNVLLVVVILISTAVILRLIRAIVNKKLAFGDKGRSHSIFLIIKYFVWVISISISLQTIGIDVSILIAGSAALFVGIGFGLQALFNDLVSGILLLIEGTIKVGDIIEVDGTVGKVTEINLRTSNIITRSDTVMIVPNHKFISEKVINWSHNDLLTRFEIEVGVAYGSDTALVKKCLLKVAQENEGVADTTKPKVFFTNFGNSSLDFKLLFWSEKVFEIPSTESDLRFAIDQIFRDNNISIPFPQRDIHIKTSVEGRVSSSEA
jgi:small-conductance mechanosensitive channel